MTKISKDDCEHKFMLIQETGHGTYEYSVDKCPFCGLDYEEYMWGPLGEADDF